MALAQRTYGAIETRAVPTRKPQTEPPQAGPRRLDFKAPADQAYLTLAFKVPQWGGMVPDLSGVMVISQWGLIQDYTPDAARKAFPGVALYPSSLARQYAEISPD